MAECFLPVSEGCGPWNWVIGTLDRGDDVLKLLWSLRFPYEIFFSLWRLQGKTSSRKSYPIKSEVSSHYRCRSLSGHFRPNIEIVLSVGILWVGQEAAPNLVEGGIPWGTLRDNFCPCAPTPRYLSPFLKIAELTSAVWLDGWLRTLAEISFCVSRAFGTVWNSPSLIYTCYASTLFYFSPFSQFVYKLLPK